MIRKSFLVGLILIVISLISPVPLEACSSFAVYGDQPIYGSNMDWQESTEARFSINDVGMYKYFLLEYRLHGSFRGMMGMNNQGLLVTLQSVPKIEFSKDHHYGTSITDLFTWALRFGKNVEEIENRISKRWIRPIPGYFLHLHVADTTGTAIVVEITEDGTQIIKREEDYSVMTNFYLSQYNEDTIDKAKKIHDRYRITTEEIKKDLNNFDQNVALEILDKIKQYSTRVSLVYLPDKSHILLALGGSFDKLWRINLKKEELETYRGFEANRKYALTNLGISSSQLGYHFSPTVAPEISYSLDTNNYQDYIGKYKYQGGFGKVFFQGDMLYFKLNNNWPLLLEPESETDFKVHLAFADLTFIKDKKGQITGFVFRNAGKKKKFDKVE